MLSARDPTWREVIAASAPRGNLAACWHGGSGRYLSSVEVVDGCGVAPATGPGRFRASSGSGGVMRIDAHTGRASALDAALVAAARWDNHLLAVPGG